MNPNRMPKLGQSDLLYGSRLPTEESGHEQGSPSWGEWRTLHHWNNGRSATIKKLIALACHDNPTERGYFCQKPWFIKVLIFMSKMLYNSPTSIFNSKNFSGHYTPRLPLKADGRGRGWVVSWLLRGRMPLGVNRYFQGSWNSQLTWCLLVFS